MENFRETIKNRVRLLATGLAIACGALIYLAIRQGYNYNYVDSAFSTPWHTAATNFQAIFFVILVAVLIFAIIKNIRTLRNHDLLNNLYIAETDERNNFIKQKTGSLAMNIVMFGLAIAAIIIGNSNPPVFFALLGSLLFVITVQVFLTVYYRHKY